MTALTKTPQITRSEASSRPLPGLFNAAGVAGRLQASPLFAIGPSEPGPALRRGALLALPVAATLIVELGFGAPTKGALGIGASICGFAAMDAPAGPRAAWQAVTAVLVGLAAALGVLSSQHAVTAVLAMGLLGLAAGYCFAVSLRLAFSGLVTVLALLIAQGLWLPPGDAGKALIWGTAGAFLQVAPGDHQTCAIRADHTATCWGDSPAPPSGTFIQVGAGLDYACGMTSDLHVVCWGQSPFGADVIPADFP